MGKYIMDWNEDSFLSKNGTILPYDKLEHAILAFIGMLFGRYILQLEGMQIFFVLWFVLNIIGILWEIFQLVIMKQLIQLKDIVANNFGILISIFLFF
jgi:hypothetical protein